jgi:beta-lactamase class C
MKSIWGAALFLLVIALVIVGSRMSRQEDHHEPVAATHPSDSNTDLFISESPDSSWQIVLADYDEYLQEALRKNLAAGFAVVVIKDTSILFLRTYGISNYSTGDSVDLQSVFRLGSVSKTFASVLAGRLVDKHKIAWDDKVVHFLPDFALISHENTEQLTLRHLLSHTSGLPYHAFTDRVDDGANLDTLIYHLRDLKLTGPPGEMYSYQNVAYSISAKIIEAATGKSYANEMSDEVFGPLKMREASMTFDEMINSEHRTQPHVYTRRGWKALDISTTYYNVGPAGGVNASISDMTRFLLALNNPASGFLSEQTLQEIFRPYVRATARNRNFRRWKRSKGSYYGMGWRVLTFPDDTVNYHGGYVNGYRAEIALSRKDRIGICVLVNSAGNLADNAIPEFLIRYEKRKRNFEIIKPEPVIAP